MQSSHFLAKLIGPVLALVGLSMLIDPAGYFAMATQFMKEPALLYLSAVLGVLGGLAIVLTHNVWAFDWRVILTLLGWISIIDSAMWLLFPKRLATFWTPILEAGGVVPVMAAIVLLLAAVLCYFGYVAPRTVRRHA